MFRGITVASECGGGGSIIARRVAERLGWSLLDRALLDAVARAAHVDTETAARYDEHVDSWWHRFHRGGLWCAAVEGGLASADVQFFDAETVASLAHGVIARAAAKGNCVIVGRGAQCVLCRRDDILHVFIYGPWGERVARVRSRGQANGNAEELLRVIDQERASYLRTYYGCDWKDPHLYHVMINSQIGTDDAASMIVDTVQRGNTQLLSPFEAWGYNRDDGI